jgi:Glycosyl hydrolases family 31/Domain of unknown function (DUF5110)
MPDSTPEFIARMRIGGDPAADPAAQVIDGDARFTVLTERLIRMEFAAGGRFEDRASYAFPNRRADVPDFRASRADDATSIDTGELVLRYRPDGRPYHAGNLEVDCGGTRWTPGLRDRQNLGGARRTVDTCRGEARLEPGLVSRSGWVHYDDSASLLIDENGWAAPRRNPAQDLDWYFFGYGHDYARAVQEYTRFGGAIPLIPRWMLGAWWSRYWAYRDRDLRELVEEFSARRFPLDVLVIDMDWHLPNSWTGYSWNRELFPDPHGFLTWLHQRGLRTALNLHPALGVQPFEDAYREFAAAMGVDSGQAIPFRIADPEYARSYFQLLHHPLEDEGVDFWWIDWQQGRTSELAGLDPLQWLNHLHFLDLRRDPARRPITFSRWGGLGSHRYPIGFSGDTFALWRALQFQPRYTAAGANVGYAWWSHDIGGHIGADSPELYVRWVQFGALSPILRLHSSKHPDNERRPWMFGTEAETAARAAFQARCELVPYLYTAARRAADTGIAPVRPMAWIAPEDDNAYAARYQYLFGDSIVAAPVVHPADPSTGLASADVWLPEGDWIERTTGELVTGPAWTRQLVPLDRIPQFVRPGTVLPLAEVAGHTGAQSGDHLVLSVFPGASGSGQIYQDDGVSSAFAHGEFSQTRFSTHSPAPDRCAVTVEPVSGEGTRRYTIRLEHTSRPLRVIIDGSEQGGWSYETGRTVIPVAARPRSSGLHVEVLSDGPLSIAGPEHNDELLVADLREALHNGSLTVADIGQIVRQLPENSPARAQAVARAGGPLIHIIEHTAPDEAADTLARIVVAAARTANVHWYLERHGAVETMSAGPVDIDPAGTVIDAPFRWDDSLDPARWSVTVSAAGNDIVMQRSHQSDVLLPSIGSWRVRLDEAQSAPALTEILSDLDSRSRAWLLFESDPSGIDFPDLPQRYDIPLQHASTSVPDQPYVIHAATRIDVAGDTDVCFAYFSSDHVEIRVDGQPVEADVTGHAPVWFYDPHPRSRRSAPVRLTAGAHTLLFRCAKAADLPWPQWCLSVSAHTMDGDVALGVTASAR